MLARSRVGSQPNAIKDTAVLGLTLTYHGSRVIAANGAG